VGVVEIRAIQVGSGKDGLLEVGVSEIRLAEVRVAQVEPGDAPAAGASCQDGHAGLHGRGSKPQRLEVDDRGVWRGLPAP
jgi:hypothetical protein